MLSCLSESGGASRMPADEISIERLANECIKLKKKNKEMKVVVLSHDAREKEREERHSSALRQVKLDNENEISTLKAQHFIELSQLKDFRMQEIKDLTLQLHTSQKTLLNQNPLVLTMNDKIKTLEKELEQTRLQWTHERAQWEDDNKSLRSPLKKWISEKQTLLSRAIAAESELQQYQRDSEAKINHLKETVVELESSIAASSIKSPHKSPSLRLARSASVFTASLSPSSAAASAVAELGRVQSHLDNLKADLVAKQDEVVYYREENSRLEKQVILLQMDLTGHTSNNRVSSRSEEMMIPPQSRVDAETITGDTPSSLRVDVSDNDRAAPSGGCDDMLSGIMSLASPSMNRSIKAAAASTEKIMKTASTHHSAAHRRGDSTSDGQLSKYISQLSLVGEREVRNDPGPEKVDTISTVHPTQVSFAMDFADENNRAHLNKIKELKTQLAEAHRQLTEQKSAVQELVSSKSKVEEGVREVLADNRALSASLDLLKRECDRLRAEIRRYKERLISAGLSVVE